VSMAKKRLPYSEGTWFAVPLGNGGAAVGVVARMDGKGRAFGYFFGPKRASIPDASDLLTLRPLNAVWSGRFGDLGILNGTWPVISRDIPWSREDWPLPPFIRVDRIGSRAWKAIYSNDLQLESDEPCSPALATRYPEDALDGFRAVEIHLTKLLQG
jgi:hypothetical protein